MTQPRALIVDDDGVNRNVLRTMLQRAGFDVGEVCSADEAIRQAQELVPDVVLLDIEMPGHDGFWVCERLKQSPATADVPVIFISAREDEFSHNSHIVIALPRILDLAGSLIYPSPVRRRHEPNSRS